MHHFVPARVRVEKPPPDSVLQHVLHLPTPVQEGPQHPFPQINDTCVFFCFGGLRCIICHGVFLWYWRYHKRRVQADQRSAQRVEFRVPSGDFDVLTRLASLINRNCPNPYSCPYSIDDVSAIWTLARFCDYDLEFGVLVKYLLYSAIEGAFWQVSGAMALAVVLLIVAQILRP